MAIKSQEDINVDEHNKTLNARTVTLIASNQSDFDLEIGKGNMSGYRDVFISGENEAVGTTAETIRSVGGRYPFPSTDVILAVSSSNVNDTSAGTGARTILLIGLDGSYIEQSEIITMNGTTPVNTILSYLRVNLSIVLTAGTSNVNEGNIDILNSANNLGRIIANEGQMRQAVRTVPAGRTWFGAVFFPSGGKDDEVRVEAFAINPAGIQLMFSKTFIYQNNFNFTNINKVPFPEKFDFEVTAVKTGAAGNARISMVVEFLEKDNNVA